MRQLPNQRLGRFAGQHAERVDLRLGFGSERRNGRGGGRPFGTLLGQILTRNQPAACPRRDKLLEPLLARELRFGIGDPLLKHAQGHVSADDFRGDRHLQVAAIPDCCSGPRPRSLNGPACLAEQVELPTRVEARAPGREFLAG